MPVALYGCQTWSLKLREDGWLRIFWKHDPETKDFGPRGMRMGSGEGSTMRKFIFCTFHLIYSGYLNLEDCLVARMEEGKSTFKILTSKPKGNKSLGRPRHWWKDNIRMNIRVILVLGLPSFSDVP